MTESPQALPGLAVVAWSLAWPIDVKADRINSNCTFDTLPRARKYASDCMKPDVCDPNPQVVIVVPLVRESDALALIAEQQRNLNAALADAERYRHLRQQDWFSSEFCVLRHPKQVLTMGLGLGADCPSRERLDDFIDTARAALAPGAAGSTTKDTK